MKQNNLSEEALKKAAHKTRTVAVLSQVGFQMAAAIGLGTYAGRWLDERLGNEKPIAAVIGALLGIFAGLYMVYRAVTQIK